MLLVLLVVSVLLNVALVATVKELKKERTATKKQVRTTARKNKEFTKGLIKTSIDLFSELEDIKERLDKLEGKNKELEDRVGKLEEANSIMANNNYQLIKEGRIIKSKFRDSIFTYKFAELTRDELISFFGRLA